MRLLGGQLVTFKSEKTESREKEVSVPRLQTQWMTKDQSFHLLIHKAWAHSPLNYPHWKITFT